jgi:Copper transport outer membrane protein, MctB
MGISLRHHVLSLVAVFLMLLVGLLVGVGLSSQPELTARIRDLTQEFQKLMGEIGVLERDAATQERFAEAAVPKLVDRRLDGRTLPMVVTANPPNNRVANDVRAALETAGGIVPYRLTVRGDVLDRAGALFGRELPPDELCRKAGNRIAAAMVAGDADGLRALDRDRLVHLAGRPTGQPVSGIIVLGGTAPGAPPAGCDLQRPLIEALLAEGATAIVGCEPRSTVPQADAFRDLDISTVDNVDLVRGRVSLVLALAGKPGRYGDGPSAEQEFAPLE